jgi:hypothetical protein
VPAKTPAASRRWRGQIRGICLLLWAKL